MASHLSIASRAAVRLGSTKSTVSGVHLPRTVMMPLRATRKSRMHVAAAVQYDYNTKVFQKELVKFADTEEYIYRYDGSLRNISLR